MSSAPVYIVVSMWKGRSLSNATPVLRATFTAALVIVPASSRKVSGSALSASVSLLAIQTWRGESIVFLASFPAWTMCHRTTPSAVAQPTHEPVASWSLIFHHVARRSTLDGSDALAATAPDLTELA